MDSHFLQRCHGGRGIGSQSVLQFHKCRRNIVDEYPRGCLCIALDTNTFSIDQCLDADSRKRLKLRCLAPCQSLRASGLHNSVRSGMFAENFHSGSHAKHIR